MDGGREAGKEVNQYGGYSQNIKPFPRLRQYSHFQAVFSFQESTTVILKDVFVNIHNSGRFPVRQRRVSSFSEGNGV